MFNDAAGIGDAASLGIGPEGGDEASGMAEGGLVDVAVGFEERFVVMIIVGGVRRGSGIRPDVGHRNRAAIHFFDQVFG